ncbi:MAG: hypothetical protein ISP86_01445 [Shewanellaceae bacterium]|nr:hypothetical protein [Shewanellaceae bacterium]
MNLQELHAFDEHPQLPVLAKLIYVFSGQRQALTGVSSLSLSYQQIQQEVTVMLSNGKVRVPECEHIQVALEALSQTPLLDAPLGVAEGCVVRFPLVTCLEGVEQRQPMHVSWQPNNQLAQFLRLYGVIGDGTYPSEALQNFVAYWLARQQAQFTQLVWTQKFAQHLQRLGLNPVLEQRVPTHQPVGLQQPNSQTAQQQNTAALVQQDFADFLKGS